MEKINRDDVMIGSPSSEGKMLIKLKIPKLEATAEYADKSPAGDVIGILSSKTVEEEKRVCLECKKEFSSGKALGGHMRVHVHVRSANKNPKFLKPATNFKKTGFQGFNNNGDRKPYYMNSVNDEGKPTCCQCGKTFPSMKSLFGHMRCHPERIWRGILPPTNTTTTVPSPRKIDDGGDGDQVIDLTKFLRGWPVTERRGRKSLKAAADNDEVLLEAVEDLMSLAHGGASMEESGVTQRQLKAEDEICGILPEKLELEDVNSALKCANKIKRRKKMKLMMELEQTAGVTGSPTALVPVPEQQKPVTDQRKYKCTTCNKSFASHQALGGHRSSHIKSKLISTDHHQIEEDDYDSFLSNRSGENLVKDNELAGGFPESDTSNSNSNSNTSLHEYCKICKKTIETGQALGGHQRCYWTGSSEEQAQAEAPSSQITSTGEAGSLTGSGLKVFDFDLNEVPPTMMEEDEAANVNGNGYASSSYNSNMG